jgi:hypothetical protein
VVLHTFGTFVVTRANTSSTLFPITLLTIFTLLPNLKLIVLQRIFNMLILISMTLKPTYFLIIIKSPLVHHILDVKYIIRILIKYFRVFHHTYTTMMTLSQITLTSLTPRLNHGVKLILFFLKLACLALTLI